MLGGVHTETDIDDLGPHVCRLTDLVAKHREVFFVLELGIFAVTVCDHRDAALIRAIGHQRHLLEPATFTTGFEAEFGKPVGNILCRRIVTGLAGHSALAQVIGQPRHVRFQRADRDRALFGGFGFRGIFAAGRQQKAGQDDDQTTTHGFCPCTAY